MPDYVTIDDPITVVFPLHVSLESVDRVERAGFFTMGSSYKLAYTDEGSHWIRGWHFPDTPEVAAARSALAMAAEPKGAQGVVEYLEALSNGFGSHFL